MEKRTCDLCGNKLRPSELFTSDQIRPSILRLIEKVTPRWNQDSFVCEKCLDGYRIQHLQTLVEQEKGELSDRMATFGGSWFFLVLFRVFLLAWIAFNQLGPQPEKFDPYPYILLNLILSCLAAIQAPIIMMSQNRQEAKDRLRGEHDDEVNLKAELEIRQLHMKIDQLLKHQWSRLLEIQQLQIELMHESRKKNSASERPPT